MERLVLMTEQISETNLLSECKNGNREAFESLYNLHQRRVFSVALNYFGGDIDKAGDVTQQVFLKFFTGRTDFRGESEFTTWLYRVTINACIDEQRKNRRFFGLAEFFGLEDKKMKQEDRVQQKQVSDEVQRVVATLKPKFRLPILLKYVEGLSYDEIAKVLDCSIGTVSSRLNRGHKLLAQKLGHLKNEI
jgi:RNA polymerase sigma-70 factor (ECF subfamily)